jgi:hypothetical protein
MELFSQFTRSTETSRSLQEHKAGEPARDEAARASASRRVVTPVGSGVSQTSSGPSGPKAKSAKESKP